MSDHLTGEFKILRVRDLTCIRAIQRQASPDRIRDIQRKWTEKKVGVLLVARITDGKHKSVLHIYDGGTRWAAKADEPDYAFRCIVTDMTQQEAAQAFLDFNGLSMKPNAFSRYQVGIQAGSEPALAIQKALKIVGISATPGRASWDDFAALGVAERVVLNFHRQDEDGSWDAASEHLAWAFMMSRTTWPHHGEAHVYAHDGNAIHAFSYIGLTYPYVVGDDKAETNVRRAANTWLGKDTRFGLLHGNLMTPHGWELVLAQEEKRGGSQSRGHMIGALIVTNYNRVAMQPQLRRGRGGS